MECYLGWNRVQGIVPWLLSVIIDFLFIDLMGLFYTGAALGKLSIDFRKFSAGVLGIRLNRYTNFLILSHLILWNRVTIAPPWALKNT